MSNEIEEGNTLCETLIDEKYQCTIIVIYTQYIEMLRYYLATLTRTVKGQGFNQAITMKGCENNAIQTNTCPMERRRR